MPLFQQDTNIQFIRYKRYAFIFSALLMLLSIASLALRGIPLGIDFSGGTLIEVSYPQAADLNQIRTSIAAKGMPDVVVQHFGTASDVLIRIAPQESLSSAQLSDNVVRLLQQSEPLVELRRQEFVGPQVGDDLAEDGGLAVIYALIGILIYVALRFEYRFAVGAVAALVHDVLITLGAFSLLQIEFDLTVLAAILAVIGYSLNDTIVVFDRIRENFRILRKESPDETVNISINQTLSRTIMTALTTLLVLVALFLFGGELIHAFAFALIVGIVIGTYSSIFVAAAISLQLGISRDDLLPVVKEGSDQPNSDEQLP
ncbi:MAG: protein translocase subunit SecF [Gammaproteobacteria bacterium]|nr:protein translocase subunit SecF [Gammaproteobacteria bacterium]